MTGATARIVRPGAAFTTAQTTAGGTAVAALTSGNVLLDASGATVTPGALAMSTARLLGRSTAGTGAVEQITLGTNLSLTGTTLNATGGATPGGSSGAMQFNNAGALGGFGSFNSGTNATTFPGAVNYAGGTLTATLNGTNWSGTGWVSVANFISGQQIILDNANQDVVMRRGGPNILDLRNGTAAQTSRVFGTFTDASNGRWLNITMSTAGVAAITPTGNGTGATGNVLHISGLPTSNPGPGILWNDAGTVKVGT